MLTDAGVDRQGGFTLIELLVTTAAATVVLIALVSIMVATLHQTQRTFTRVDATRQARPAFARLENELHSACAVPDTAPIQPGSTHDTLQFLSFIGDATVSGDPTKTASPDWHVVRLDGTTLTDTTYAASNPAGRWLRGAEQGREQLAQNVAARPDSRAFEYYSYDSYPAPDGDLYWAIPDGVDTLPDGRLATGSALDASGAGLSDGAAASAVEVVVGLEVFASSQDLANPKLTGTSDPVTDAVSLRLTSPPDETPAKAGAGSYGPCQ